MADFTEKQVYEALGVQPEEPAGGANEQEPAAPADQGTKPGSEQGANEQEPAVPAPDEGTPAEQDQPPASGEGGQEEPDGGKPPMTEQERKEAAAQRRRQEQQAAIDEAVSKALQAEREKSEGELAAFFQAAQLKNTFTGKPITSMAEFQEWKQAYDAAQLQRDLKAGKLTPETLGKAISDTPAMQKVQEIIDRDERAKQEQGEAAAKQKIAAELVEIQKLDPSIKDLADLLKMPTAKEFYAYVTKNHLSYLDAFRLANQERLAQQATEAARQQAMTNARGKDHMTPTKAQGAGSAPIPDGEMAMYRLLNPEATEEQIRAHFNKFKS